MYEYIYYSTHEYEYIMRWLSQAMKIIRETRYPLSQAYSFTFAHHSCCCTVYSIIQQKSDLQPDGHAGDVVVVLACAKHKLFERRGDHLYIVLHVSLVEALCGCELVG